MKKRMVKITAAMLAVLMMTSCAGNTESAQQESTASAPEQTSASLNEQTSASTEQSTTSATTAQTTEPVVEEEPAPLPASVELSHGSGIYPEQFSLELSGLSDGEIYYTLDGSDPTTSDTALLYSEAIEITDRKGDKNVVSAVDPVLFAGSFNKPNKERNDFVCEISAPDDEDVDKCTVVRAAVKGEDGSFLGETAATYFIGTTEEHIEGLAESCAAAGEELAVISISMNYDDLFDSEKGIYVKGDIFAEALETLLQEERRVRDGETARQLDANYKQRGREWEREAYMTMFEFSVDGAETVLSQACGIRVQGNYSRSDVQKGFRLYARSEYGDKNFRYEVFGDECLDEKGETLDKFKTLVLRAGGNCAFTSKFNDTYWQQLAKDTACDTKRSRPCVVYLNGEYWGLYVLEEDFTDDFLEDHHGVNKDDVVIYKGDAETYAIGYKLDEGEIPQGDVGTNYTDEVIEFLKQRNGLETDDELEEFLEDITAEELNGAYYFGDLIAFFNTHKDLSSAEDYEEFTKLVDPQSVMDYFAVQCWINNKWDWPGKNWSMWRTIATDPSNEYADGRWRFMIYDVEFGGVSGAGDAGTNTIKEDNYKPDGLLDMDTNNPAVLCFAYLMTNDGFRQGFYDRISGLSSGIFEKQTALDKLQEFQDIYAPLYDQFFERYPETGDTRGAVNGGYASIQCIRDFVSRRENAIDKMIKFCDKILGPLE